MDMTYEQSNIKQDENNKQVKQYKKKIALKEDKKDYRQELTDKVKIRIEEMISHMEANPDDQWNKPWFSCNERPVNPATGTVYKGINVISLMSADFVDNRFYTYNNIAEMEKIRAKNVFELNDLSEKLEAKAITQAEFDQRLAPLEKSFQELEAKGLNNRLEAMHIIKGSKAIPVFKAVQVSFKSADETNDNEADPKPVENVKAGDAAPKIWMQAHSGNVFNATQITNMKPLQAKSYTFIPHEEAETHLQSMIVKTGLTYNEVNKGRAFYSPANHAITMPPKELFRTGNDYYGTLLHEISHSTGKALGRDLSSGGFGSKSYAKEEMVAEISSVLMSADLGIPYDASQHENNVAYLKSWLGALNEDKNYIFKAASQAEKSVNYQHEQRAAYKADLVLQQAAKTDLKAVVVPKVLPVVKREFAMSM